MRAGTVVHSLLNFWKHTYTLQRTFDGVVMFNKIHSKLKKESCRKVGNGLLVMALICCLMFVSYQATSAVITSATVGDRELPIYCVDTTEKKVALSFDAAWGAEDFPRIMHSF